MSSFSGIDCDLILLDGEFCIQNVPTGTYRVLIEKMDVPIIDQFADWLDWMWWRLEKGFLFFKGFRV